MREGEGTKREEDDVKKEEEEKEQTLEKDRGVGRRERMYCPKMRIEVYVFPSYASLLYS